MHQTGFYDNVTGNVLFQLFQEPLQFVLEDFIATDAKVFADSAAVGRNGLVVGDAIELEEVLQTVEVGAGDADGLFVGQPFVDILMIGVAALGGALSSNKNEFHVIAFGNLGA